VHAKRGEEGERPVMRMRGSPGPSSAALADDVELELDRTLNPDDMGM